MIAHAEKRQHAETEAVTKDLYAALAPLRSRLDALEREVEQLKALKELAEGGSMSDEVTVALEDLANRFENAGEAIWTGSQVADTLRRYANDRDTPLTNRDDEAK
jgi:phage shock protein A